MADEILSIEYYKKDKEMRDIIQSFHEMLDLRYKEASSNLKSLYQAKPLSILAGRSSPDNNDDVTQGSTTTLHVAEIHCEDQTPCIDNPGFSPGSEDVSYGLEHGLAMEQVKDGIELLFGSSFVKGALDKNNYQTNALDKKLLGSSKNYTIVDGIAPHFCTVAWIREPKRYQECKAIVRTVGPNKKPLEKGGADIKGILSWSRYDKQFCKVVDNEDGTYHIIYSACSVRFHLLFVTVNGCDVAGSPFIVDVDDDDSWD